MGSSCMLVGSIEEIHLDSLFVEADVFLSEWRILMNIDKIDTPSRMRKDNGLDKN